MGDTDEDAEACGRCAMSSVVGVAADGDDDGGRDPFAGDRIEIDEREARLVSPAAWLGGLRRRVDAVVGRLIHGGR
jgi:hypothetical protein